MSKPARGRPTIAAAFGSVACLMAVIAMAGCAATGGHGDFAGGYAGVAATKP